MKNAILRIFLLPFTFLTFVDVIAQAPTYDIYIANRALTSVNTMEFDVFIKSNGSTTVAWPMRSFQCGYQFSSAFVNGGTLSASYVAGSSELTETTFGKTWGFSYNSTNKIINQSANTGSNCPGASIGTNARKICRVRISNTANWGCADDNVTIRKSGTGFLVLKVTKYATANCSDPTVQDLDSTSATTYTQLPNESLLRAAVTGTLSVSCGGTTDLTVTASGGVTPYTGAQTYSVGAGSQSYTVTDARGCTASTSATVSSVPDVTPPVIQTCASDQSVTAFTASVPVFSGVIATDNCTSSNSLLITQSPAAGTTVGIGVTNVTITVADAAGNSSTCTSSFTVNEPCNVSASVATTHVTCFGGSNGTAVVTLSGSGTSASGSYSIDGGIVQSYSTNPFAISGLSGGSYSVDITSGNCNTSGSFNITTPAAPIVTSLTDAACGSYTLPWGPVVTQTDVYSNIYTSASGCDSTVVIDLTITPVNFIPSAASACDSYTWAVNGVTYTASGNYTHPGANCDRYTLSLTITASTNSTTNVSTCSAYTWNVNGNTYTESGTYTSVSGCNTQYLVLTVNTSSNETAGTVSGASELCTGATSLFTTDGTAGGTWSSSNASVATVNSSTGLVTGGTVSGTAIITYSITDACGSVLTAGKSVSVLAPFSVSAITGPADACPFLGASTPLVAASNATYSISAVAASGFSWTMPSGASLISGQGTNAISVHFASTFSSGIIRVTVTSLCNSGTSLIRSITVSKGSRPSTPVSILNTNICNFKGNGIPATLTVSPRPANVTHYRWGPIPTFVTIVGASPDSTSINILVGSGFDAASSTQRKITVTAINGCGISNTQTVTLTSTAPVAASVIRGPGNVCLIANNNRDTSYSIAAINGASSYSWTVPNGVTITNRPFSGTSNDTIIFVRFATGYGTTIAAGSISVRGINNCGTGSIKSLSVTRTLPSTPGTISRTTISSACPSQRYIYKVSAMAANARFLSWTVPAGAVIDSVTNRSLWCYVTYPASGTVYSGNVVVVGVNSCGNGSARTLSQSISACAPAFADNNNSSQPVVKVNQNMELSLDLEIQAFPNPTTAGFNLRAFTKNNGLIHIRIMDAQGREYKRAIMIQGETLRLGSDLRAGTYFVEAIQGKNMKTVRVIKL